MSVRAAGGKANDDAHRPRRIGLRPRDPRHGRQRGSARGQMQKLSAGKFHGDDPSSTFSRRISFLTRQQTAAAQYLDPANARLGSLLTELVRAVCPPMSALAPIATTVPPRRTITSSFATTTFFCAASYRAICNTMM